MLGQGDLIVKLKEYGSGWMVLKHGQTYTCQNYVHTNQVIQAGTGCSNKRMFRAKLSQNWDEPNSHEANLEPNGNVVALP